MAIFARGACDDKGQFYMHLKAFELMMRTSFLGMHKKVTFVKGFNVANSICISLAIGVLSGLIKTENKLIITQKIMKNNEKYAVLLFFNFSQDNLFNE